MQYSSRPELNKAYVQAYRNRYAVYKYTSVTKDGSVGTKVEEFRTREEALDYAFELNDWQRLGSSGNEVYKGDAEFNKAHSIEPWEHLYIRNNKAYCFVWDTRELTKVIPIDKDDMNRLHVERSDNHKPICKNGRWLQLSELLKQ